jgi:hypothetical protein
MAKPKFKVDKPKESLEKTKKGRLTKARKAEIDKETAGAVATALASEKKRREASGGGVDETAGVKFTPAKGTERPAGEEDQGPSAAPKIQLKGPLVSTGKKMRQKGLRPAKNREMQKGVMAVTVANEAPKPRKTKAKSTTRTGKKIDPKTGQVAVPKKGQAAKVDGKVVRVDSTNIEEAQRQAKTTVLPTAGPEAPKPKYELPGAPNTVAEQGYSQSSPEHHERVKSLTAKAFLHLGRMQSTHGTDEYHSHHAEFNETHAHVSQLDHSMGQVLKTAHTAVSNPSNPDSPKQFAWAKQAAGERLGLGKKTMDARTERSQAGRAKRMERIRAEQAAKEGNK